MAPSTPPSVVNPSEDSRFILIEPEEIGTHTRQFAQDAQSLTATFYSLHAVGDSFLDLLAGKAGEGNYIVNYGFARNTRETEVIDRNIITLESRGSNVYRFSEPSSRTRIHAKTYISEDKFLISSQNPSEGFDEDFQFNPRSSRSFVNKLSVYLGRLGLPMPRSKVYQINYAIQSGDPALRQELLGITEAIQRGESPRSTRHFITGGANSNSSEIIQHYINQAEKGEKLQFGSAYMDDPAIVSALVKAKERGVEVEGIVNNQESLNVTIGGSSALIVGALQFLADSGIPLYAPTRTDPLKQHSKFMIIGDRVISGSHNFTSAANQNSVEITLNVEDSNLADQFKGSVSRLKSTYGLQRLYANFNPERQASASYHYYAQTHVQLEMQSKGISNSNFAFLGTKTTKDDLKVPSVLPSSYFYSRAVHNATLSRQGDLTSRIKPSEIFKKREESYEPGSQYLGILSSQYAMVKLIQQGTIPDTIPEVFRKYDRALEQGSFGDALNELFVGQGLGRLYKSEIGVIPSFMGSIGRVLDSTIAYYGAEVPDYLLRVNQLNEYQIQERPAGPFESILTTLTENFISSSFSILTYLTVTLPIKIGYSKIIENLANRALSDVITKGSQASVLNRIIVGTSDPKLLSDPNFYKGRLNLLSLHYFARKSGQVMFDHVIRPIVENVISPFKYGSSEYTHLSDFLDKYSQTLGKPIVADVSKKVYEDFGFTQEQNLAKAFEEIGNALPLNPLNWRLGREGFDIGENYVRLSQVISQEKATQAVEEAMEPLEKALKDIQPSGSLTNFTLNVRDRWKKTLKAIQQSREVLEIDNQLSKSLKKISDMEDSLIKKGALLRTHEGIEKVDAIASSKDLENDFKQYNKEIKNQAKSLREKVQEIVEKDKLVPKTDIDSEVDKRLQDFYDRVKHRSTLFNIPSEMSKAALGNRSSINGLPPTMFLRTVGLTALSLMVFSAASSFLLDSQRGVPQFLQMRAQRELDQEEAGITEITATRLFDLSLEVDVAARIAYLSGAVALGHFVNTRQTPFQQDEIVISGKTETRIRRSRTRFTTKGLLTTLGVIVAPTVAENAVALARKFFRFIRGKSSSMPVTSQAQAVASNLTLFSQDILQGERDSAVEIQAAYQADQISSMLSFVYENRFRKTDVIAVQAPTPFFQVFLTLPRRGQREQDGVPVGGAYYPSFGVQAPSVLGAGFNVEMPFGFTREKDESGTLRGSIFGLVYNPSQDSVANYLYALSQVSLGITAGSLVAQTVAVTRASPEDLDVRVKQARASISPLRNVENILSLPLLSTSIFKATGLILKEGVTGLAVRLREKPLFNKVPRGLASVVASTAASAAVGYLLTETVTPEDQVSTQLIVAGVGTAIGLAHNVKPLSNYKKQTSLLALATLAAAVITDPEFEFMRSEGEELTQDYLLERAVTGSIVASFIGVPLYQAHRAVSATGVTQQLKRVDDRLKALEGQTPSNTFQKFERAYLLNRQADLKILEQHHEIRTSSPKPKNWLDGRNIGIHYNQNLFRVQLPRAVAAGFALSLVNKFILEHRAPSVGDWIQNALDTFRGGRKVETEPLLRDSLITQNLLTRDGLTERVSPVDPQFARSAQRQPILRALSRSYYLDAPNSFLGTVITPFGVTFRSTPEGMIGTPYLQFQAASVDISLGQTAMPLMRGGALSAAMSNSYDLLFMLQSMSGMSPEMVSYSLLNLTASLPTLAKRRTVSRPSEMVMSYIAKDPLLTYITQGRIARSASDSYKRPESLYFSMENEAWRTITSSLPLATIQSMSPSQMDRLINELMYAGGITQNFNLIPNAAGLGRLRYASNQNIEDLINFSSPYYEDEVTPRENRFLSFIRNAWQSSHGGISLPSFLLGAAAFSTAFSLLISLSQTSPTELHKKVDLKYRDLGERLSAYKERDFPSYYSTSRMYGDKYIKVDDLPRASIEKLITDLETRSRLFIDRMLGIPLLGIPSLKGHTSLKEFLIDKGFDNLDLNSLGNLDDLNTSIKEWFEQSINKLFSYGMQDIDDDAKFDQYRIASNLSKDKLKKEFKEALEDIRITKRRSFFFSSQQKYRLGGFFEPADNLNLDIISKILTSTFLEKVEEPLKELRNRLGGYTTSTLTSYEALAEVEQMEARKGVSSSSKPIRKIKAPKSAPEEFIPTAPNPTRTSWLQKGGGLVSSLLGIISGLEFIGAVNLGLRITTAYADDAPEGYLNNLIDSFATDALTSLLYSGLSFLVGKMGVNGFIGTLGLALGYVGYLALDSILGRFERTENLTKTLSFHAKEGFETVYRTTVETVGSFLPVIEEEDVAFGLTAAQGVMAVSGLASFVSSLGFKLPQWLTNPFMKTGEAVSKGVTNTLIRPASKLLKTMAGRIDLKAMGNVPAAIQMSRKVISKAKGKSLGLAVIGAAAIVTGAMLIGAASRGLDSFLSDGSEAVVYRGLSGWMQGIRNYIAGVIPVAGFLMVDPMEYMRQFNYNSAQNPFLVATPEMALKQEYLQMLSSAGQDMGRGIVSYFISSDVHGIPNRYSREAGAISREFEGMGPKRLLDPLLDRMLMIRGQDFNNRVIGQMNWRAIIRRATNYRELQKAMNISQAGHRSRRTNTNALVRRLGDNYDLVLMAIASLSRSPEKEPEAVRMAFAEVPKNRAYEEASLAAELATHKGQAGTREVRISDLGPGQGFEIDIVPSQNHLVESAATQYLAYQNTMLPAI